MIFSKKFALAFLGIVLAGGVVFAGFLAIRAHRPGRATNTVTEVQTGKQTYQLTEDGVDREFIVYMPDNLPANEDVPVVFMFHGTGGNGNKFYNISGWKEQADKEGFIAVFPSALRYHIFEDVVVQKGVPKENVASYTTKWNFIGFQNVLDPSYPDQKLADDVQFTRDMVSFLDEHYPVDASRMYVSGFSNGAQFCSRLAVEATDVFAAFGCVARGAVADVVAEGVRTEIPDFVPRPMMNVTGEKDPKGVYKFGVDAFPMDESLVDPTGAFYPNLISPFLTMMDLKDEYTYESSSRFSSFTYDVPAGEDVGQLYQFVVISGMEHIYPNGKNFPVNASEYFWKFFEQYSL